MEFTLDPKMSRKFDLKLLVPNPTLPPPVPCPLPPPPSPPQKKRSSQSFFFFFTCFTRQLGKPDAKQTAAGTTSVRLTFHEVNDFIMGPFSAGIRTGKSTGSCVA